MNNKQKQHLLAYLGYYIGEINGELSKNFEESTRRFQAEYGGLEVDGICGSKTQKAMKHAAAYGMPGKEVIVSKTENTADDFWGGIKHFTRDEFRCPCGKCGGFPVEPNKKLVLAADEMREEFGCPVIVVPPDGHSGGSGVRCQTYNDSLPGSVPNSRHVCGKAMDFKSPGKSESAIEAYLSKIKFNDTIRYWYKISSGSYHMDVE